MFNIKPINITNTKKNTKTCNCRMWSVGFNFQLLSGVLCHVENTCLKSVHLHAGDLL